MPRLSVRMPGRIGLRMCVVLVLAGVVELARWAK
jgi:hypothetical protein